MSLLLIRVVNRLGYESAKADNSLTYKKIFVLALRYYVPHIKRGRPQLLTWPRTQGPTTLVSDIGRRLHVWMNH